MTVSASDIKAAAQEIAGEVVRTPLVPAPRLSERLGCELYLKLESLQYTGSFKDRGALNKLKSLTPEQAKYGVIAMSSGNHAQGVAYHARRLGIPAVIVMPEFAPFSKVERTRELGARVVLVGDTLDASALAAREIAEQENLTFVHPYDDPKIIAGQGTIGFEMLEDQPDLDTIVVPIGGGGIISGIAIAAKSVKPEIEIYGVEAELFPSMYQAINGLAPTSGGQTLADGIAVKKPGALTRPIIEELVADILLVGEELIEAAIHTLVEEQKIVAGGGSMLLEERLGPVSWRFAVRPEADSLEFALRGASLLGIPLPAVLRPTIRARESVHDGRFHFDAEVRLPLLGRLIHYSGDLQPRAAGG